MVSVQVDTSELRGLVADMRAADGRLTRHIIPTLKKGGVNIKKTWAADMQASGDRGFAHVGSTINFDLHTSPSEMSVEVGPDKPSGALANIAIWGTSRGGGTRRDPAEHLEKEADGFAKALSELAEGIVL